MRPIVRAALVIAGLSVVTQVAVWLRIRQPIAPNESPAGSVVGSAMLEGQCPPGTLPDNHACIPVPEENELPAPPVEAGAVVARLPDRPRSFGDYTWPVALTAAGAKLSSDLVLSIPQHRGIPVRLITFQHQVGDAEVVAIGQIWGTTVVTRHTVRHPNGLRRYIAFYGPLEKTDPAVVPGSSLAPDTVLGAIGDSGQQRSGQLEFEVRQVRRHVELAKLPIDELRHPARTIPCDPRNVAQVINSSQ